MTDLPNTMRAVRIRHFGGPEVAEITDVDVPRPREGELLLKVEMAGLNPVDWKICSGKYPAVTEDKLPYILGRDLSATVVQARTGPGAADLAEGTLVHGLLDIARGTFAQYVIAYPNEVVRVPASLDRASAAALPLAGLTAWQGLFDHGGLRSGQRVLIHAAAGGVGHLAVQFARARGANVIATASDENIPFVRSLGADEVIDYRKTRFEEQVRDVDLVYDLIGGDTQQRSWGVLKRGGTLVSTVQAPPPELAEAHGVRAMRYTAVSNARQLREIDALVEAGQVRVLVARSFPFTAVDLALRSLQDGHGSGKLVLDMQAV